MQAIFGVSLKTPIPMKKPWRLLVFLIVVLFSCLAVFIFGQRRAFGTDPSVESKANGQDDVPGETRGMPEQSSMKADSPVRRRDERVTPEVSRQGVLDQMRPSQVAGRVFPKLDPDVLAFRLPQEQFAVYERMRAEFPAADWTEIESAHQAFLDKRAEFPLNLDEGQREAYAAWLGEAEPVSRALVRLRAEEHGLSANGIENGRGYYIDGFREGVPVYVATSNVGCAETTGVKFVRWNPGFDPALGDTINGGELYVNINDHGTIYENPEFQLPNAGGSRILYKEINDGGSRDHMTHVAGTVAAWGYDSSLQGMVPRAWIRSLIQQSVSDITTFGMATPGQQMVEINPRTGNPQLRSVIGNTSLGTTNPYNRYDASSASYDTVLRDYPYYLHFNSSGNSGSGYETLTGGWKIAKSMISIGNASSASRNAEGVYTGGGDLSGSSSRGPTYDGRINPDFVAKGSSVLSTTSETGSGYKSGTSMASPNAAGSAALLMDYVRQRLPQQYLRSSTYRALLASTADDRGNPGPDYAYGWGILNIHAAAKIVRQQAENSALQLIVEDSLSPNQTWTGTTTYLSDGSKPIRVSIAWLDPAGAASATDDRSSRLVNDLDLRVIGPGGTEYKPYVMPFTTGKGTTPAFDSSLYGAHAVPGDNITDPVEQVYIAAPAVGFYTVQVTHKGTLKDQQAQPFSLAVSGSVTSSGLAHASPIVFTEAVAQNGLLSPGEEAVATVPVVNHSRVSANGVVATLTTTEPGVTLLSNTISYGTLTAGQTSTGDGSFRIRLEPDISPRLLAFTLILTSTSSGDSWSFPVTFTCVSEVAINGYVRDGHGNPVAGATVSWAGTRSGQTTSAANGSYAISEVDGTYNLTASKSGYVSRSAVSLTVPPYVSQDLFLDYYDLAVSPTEVAMEASIGQTTSSPLTLTNTGTRPINWSIRADSYTFTTSDQAGGPTYVWNDISTTGTQVTGLGDDTNHGPFPIGFSMPFYGQNFTSVRICSNGWLSFTSTATTITTSTLPNSSRPENLIAAFMRDLDLRTEGTVHYQQVDDSTFVVQFTNVPRYGATNSTKKATFQVVLKRDGRILFYYQTTDDPTIGLVGIQNAAKNNGLTIAYNQALLKSGLAVSIEPLRWLGVTPVSGTIAVGAMSTVTLSANATGMEVGTYPVDVFVDSNDAGNPVQAVEVWFDVVSNQATITAWPTASAIVYGQPLSASTLSGGSAEVSGTFAFDDPGALFPAGSHSVAVTFTPDDEVNYSTVTGNVTVTVAKATPVVTAWPSASAIEEGQALSASALTGGSVSTSGGFAFVNPSFTPPLGDYAAVVRFTPADPANFNPVDGSVNVVVQKPTPSVTTWPTASGIVYGQALSASTLSGGAASVSGTFAFSAPATTPNAGAYVAAVTFTPADTANYSPVSGSVAVQVAKATPVITAWPTASAVNQGQYLGSTSLSGGSASVPGTFAFSDPVMRFNGQDAFTFRVSDGVYTSGQATVSINGGTPQAAPDADPVAQSVTTRGDGYTVVTLTAGSGTWTVPDGVSKLEVLVVGGGGGGGASTGFSNAGGGGGGAGGLVHVPEYPVTAGSGISYAVGAGGTAGSGGNIPGNNGGNSVFGDLTALGGGGGSGGNMVGKSGGSGGGSRINTVVGGTGQQPSQAGLSGQYGFGRNGGAVNDAAGSPAGGGGGAGAAGAGTAGGAGKSVTITGSAVTYAGGGGGGGAQTSTPGAGGSGGGGGGGNNGTAPTAGTPNTGGGGGGGNNSRAGAGGGSGVVIIAYQIENLPPVANAQSVTVEPGTPTAITLAGSDPDNDALAFEIVISPVHGTLSGIAPNLTYTPPVLPAVGAHQVTVVFTPADTANHHSVTGTVSVSVGGGTPAYQNWAGQYPSHDLSEASGDNDGDGMNNFHEFAFGLDPTDGNSSNPIVTPLDRASRSFSYTRRAGSGLAYTVCVSTDLNEWRDLPPDQAVESVVESTEAGAETVNVTLSSLPDSGNLFLRVRAD